MSCRYQPKRCRRGLDARSTLFKAAEIPDLASLHIFIGQRRDIWVCSSRDCSKHIRVAAVWCEGYAGEMQEERRLCELGDGRCVASWDWVRRNNKDGGWRASAKGQVELFGLEIKSKLNQ